MTLKDAVKLLREIDPQSVNYKTYAVIQRVIKKCEEAAHTANSECERLRRESGAYRDQLNAIWDTLREAHVDYSERPLVDKVAFLVYLFETTGARARGRAATAKRLAESIAAVRTYCQRVRDDCEEWCCKQYLDEAEGML